MFDKDLQPAPLMDKKTKRAVLKFAGFGDGACGFDRNLDSRSFKMGIQDKILNQCTNFAETQALLMRLIRLFPITNKAP